MDKLVYRFNNQGRQVGINSKEILGGKGTNLAQMAKLGLPVPPGFTISTKVCEFFYKNKKKLPKNIFNKIKKEINVIEKISDKKLHRYVRYVGIHQSLFKWKTPPNERIYCDNIPLKSLGNIP